MWFRDKKTENPADHFFCPMIDARRMEVYSAIFDSDLNLIRETQAEIIDENSFVDLLNSKKVVFAGDGAEKCEGVFGENSNAIFITDLQTSSQFLAPLSEKEFQQKNFEDVAYFEPFYLKDFVAGIPRVKGLK